jgi:hypothetical protein
MLIYNDLTDKNLFSIGNNPGQVGTIIVSVVTNCVTAGLGLGWF